MTVDTARSRLGSPARRTLAVLITLACAATLASWDLRPADAASQTSKAVEAPHCQTVGDRWTPPCNPYLAQSPWSATHGGPFRQSSTARPTATKGNVRAEHLFLPGLVPIWAHFSEPYADGRRVIWASLAGSNTVVKIDERTFQVIAQTSAGLPSQALGGAYYELNHRNQLIRLAAKEVQAVAETNPGQRTSPIALVKSFQVPRSFFCRNEELVGLGHTYDGSVVFATELGQVGVLPADPTQWRSSALRRYSINGRACNDTSVPVSALEQMTNNFAIDERGGIYPVTSRALYRLRWKAADQRVTQHWRTPYRSSADPGAVEVGEGSGSTPTLMGTRREHDRLVAITDGQDVRNLVLMWRGRIPRGWRPIAPGRPRRIACEIPVDFGEPQRERTATEQSVTVSGYSAIVVDNLLRGNDTLYAGMPRAARVLFSGLAGGDPAQAPHGMERLDWNPRTNKCRTVWANVKASFPNGIPLVTRGSNLVIGNSLGTSKEGAAVFGARALDFGTGRLAWFRPGVAQTCPEAAVKQLSLLGPVLQQAASLLIAGLGNACENGFYSQLSMGPRGVIYTGTVFGMSRWVPR